jgi:hypothetical protein
VSEGEGKTTKGRAEDEQVSPKQEQNQKKHAKTKEVDCRQAQAEPVFILYLSAYAG